MIPAWLLAKGGGNLRTAGARQCACGATVLAGLDADRAAMNAVVDLAPVDEMGEVIAIAQGRATYDLVGDSRRKELEYRYEWNIRAKRRYPVLVAHKCGAPIPAAPPTEVPDKSPGGFDDDRCPF
ncbi:hypothetical protein Skr01_36460 [Sphaerisporangium krabiense]|uniref:Uncharacterized protein n=1 Tax=Sphaerisporangium krabiense TaxID=763782 RepID=A0A7W8Z3N2_9ACTN|nr:hypothetical protein [Sphaerisporangium krabiense]MBB5626640.1 hypothetical protein [Sphaerisporangium krabiense]GII63561.1 hypothetical protein Skr01_36460 [Sphaerisporangium krabiense]